MLSLRLRPPRYVSIAALAVLISGLLYGRFCLVRLQRAYGCYTREQILERSQSLCNSLVSETNDLQVSVHLFTWQRQDGTRHPFWFVDYTDRHGYRIVCQHWNAETGELYYVG